MNEYERLREMGPVGFAHVYLKQCNRESKTDIEIHGEVYSKLIELDTRLGTTAAEQLFWCLYYTLNLDIIQVLFKLRINEIKIILDDKYGAS